MGSRYCTYYTASIEGIEGERWRIVDTVYLLVHAVDSNGGSTKIAGNNI
jgi:ribosomal silencing factor RsfS